MSKFSHKQSQLQPKSNHLVLSLLGSMLIHGVIVLILSRNQTPQPEIIEEPIQVIILEPTVSRSPEVAAISEPRSKSKPLVSSTPKNSPPSNSVTATPKSPLSSTETRSIPTPAPIKTAPVKPAPQKQPSPAKIESDSTTQKLDNSSISTSTETSVKSPQIPSQPKKINNAEGSSGNNQAELSRNSELPNKLPISSDFDEIEKFRERHKLALSNQNHQKPLTSPLDKPATPETSQTETNSLSTSGSVQPEGLARSDRNFEENKKQSTLSESSSIATNSSNQSSLNNSSATVQKNDNEDKLISSDNSSVGTNLASPSDAENNNAATQSNSTAAENTIAAESNKPLAISCRKNCQPQYPSALNGAEGSAGIQLTINSEGQVIDAAIAVPHSNSQLNQEALQAARSMKFSSIDRDRATVRINISFTVAGSDFERQLRQE